MDIWRFLLVTLKTTQFIVQCGSYLTSQCDLPLSKELHGSAKPINFELAVMTNFTEAL